MPINLLVYYDEGDKMIIEKTFKINSKIEIAIVDDEENQIFANSVIQEVNNDSFSILVPIHDGHVLYLAEGDKVVVSLLLNNLRYAFETEVLRKERKAEINMVVLIKPQQLTTSDRRNLVRIKTLVPTKYEIVNNLNIDKWESIVPTFDAYVTDLSGTGLSLTLELPMLKETLMVLSIDLETNDINVKVKLLGEVVRCEKIDRRYRIGVKFNCITERQQRLIIRYVFHSLRKSIQLHKDDY